MDRTKTKKKKTSWIVLGLAASLALAGGPAPGPVGAARADEEEPPRQCLDDLQPTLTVTPAVVNAGEGIRLEWSAIRQGACSSMRWSITGPGMWQPPVGPASSKTVFPTESGQYLFQAHMGGLTRDLATAAVTVNVPPLPMVDGRPNVAITSNAQVALFVQAVGTPNAVVRVANDVELDLSGRENVPIASGVRIVGGRSSTSRGPRLFTTTFPGELFQINRFVPGKDVRITGVRLEGAEFGSAAEDAPSSNGIVVHQTAGIKSTGIEIDNNEIAGWRGTAVEIIGPVGAYEPPPVDAFTFAVRVHDNFIHHNQHLRTEGYGVAVKQGAVALFENNVFDYNRHAIESAPDPGTGYVARGNLVLENGGINRDWSHNQHTHMLDVHGSEECHDAEAYCGVAGGRYVFEGNTILYDHGTGIKVRGKPEHSALSQFNVFSHGDEWGGYYFDGAMAQNAPAEHPPERMEARDNTFGVEWDAIVGPFTCDFDGDGVRDTFLASGAGWWFSSGRTGNWVHRSDSRVPMSGLTIGQFNGDPYCDVRHSNGAVSLTPPGRELNGMRFRSPDSPNVFLILDGKRYFVPSAAVYLNLFRDWNGIGVMDLSGIPDGGPLSSYAQLARSPEEPAVYLVSNDRRFWISSGQAMDAYRFDWNRVGVLPRQVLETLPRGGDLSVGPFADSRKLVPDVVGYKREQASPLLAAAGFVSGTVTFHDDCNNIGYVFSQTPRAGSLVAPGTAVDLKVGKRPRTPCQ